VHKPLSIGDAVKLPSGRYVKIVCRSSASRPWQAAKTGYVWHVCRPHQDAAQAGASYYFDPAKPTPLQLDEADAKALAEALNSVRALARASRI
jgi:hypothetical protein